MVSVLSNVLNTFRHEYLELHGERNVTRNDDAHMLDGKSGRMPYRVFSNVKLGKNVTIKPYAVLGGDGFGYKRDSGFSLVKIEHFGGVIIGDNVDIGSCTCIDCGQDKGTNTVVGEGTKIDNLVHVAHNVVIGKHCLLVAGVSLGGSSEIGDYSTVGLNAMIKPAVKIGKKCMVGMGAVVLEDVLDETIVVGNPARILRKNEYFKSKVR